MQENSEQRWAQYYEDQRKQRGIEPIYHEVIDRFSRENSDKPLRALDLGSGIGSVALEIARESAKREAAGQPVIEVTAEDENCLSLRIIEEDAKKDNLAQYITPRQRDMTKVKEDAPKELFDLITARAIFYWLPKHAHIATMVLENVTKKLAPGSYAVVEFLGTEHQWKAQCHTHTREEVESYFPKTHYSAVEIHETTDERPLVNGRRFPFWHEMVVVAKMNSESENAAPQEGAAAVAEKEQPLALHR